MIGRYLFNLLYSLDQLLNTFLGGNADETLSSRLYREGSRFRHVVNALFFWQDEHCKQSFLNEYKRRTKFIAINRNKFWEAQNGEK